MEKGLAEPSLPVCLAKILGMWVTLSWNLQTKPYPTKGHQVTQVNATCSKRTAWLSLLEFLSHKIIRYNMVIGTNKPLRFGIACYSDEINIYEWIYWLLIVVSTLHQAIPTRSHSMGRSKVQLLRDWALDWNLISSVIGKLLVLFQSHLISLISASSSVK